MQLDANGWLDVAIEIDYQDKSMSRQGYTPTHLVLHGTAGGVSAEAVARNVFQDPSVEASAHFIIGQDAHVVQGVPCSLAAWGNGILDQPRLPFPPGVNSNLYTISIEHCKPSTDNSDALTAIQQQMSFLLIKCLCEFYGIPKRRGDATGGIVSHADFDSVTRANCPGPYPWDAMISFINGGAMNIPAGWTYNATTKVLTAKNGHTVRLGNAQFILAVPNWDGNNVPLEEEHGTAGGSAQTFLTCMLDWQPSTGVQYAPLGAQYLTEQSQLAAAQTQIALLQSQLAALNTTTMNQVITQANAILTQLSQHSSLVAADIASIQTAIKAITPPSS